ncbi:Hypothetical protein R9X50_00239000 [Acrodontium crateriforme]|uniref:SSD domain-containing protein n=1 Tax=Acrodontium crateriforme TaxID=150365 RepID=A0AAQ3M3S7_9PEZI|nr:Hypothetical protein R9X50_00239000 [Acrodontium crateriforme]
MAFSYPTVFLSENPTAGFAAYPHHFWTTAKPFEGEPSNADVEMRQVWVHGSYMQALDKTVLKNALKIQQTLVGDEKRMAVFPALDPKLRTTELSWGYHSPLLYWNNSAQMIDEDNDILRTINEQSRSSSSLNVALRPASVLAGKQFDRWKLQAADALVITLMNRVENGAGAIWHDRMKTLTAGPCQNCTLFPHDGHVTRSRVYEFSFTPLSVSENLALAFAYSCMALYVLVSLHRMKAFHSRFGLVVTAITQITCSILSSITICGVLKINLSMVPQSAYPFVVLVIGLENMFRLINAIVQHPATMDTELRVANALGDVGPVSVAAAAQNLIILSLLSRFVSPGVAAFCAFACIATIFDAFFLLTFFVAVLNVDIKRLELQDAISRSNQAKTGTKRKASPVHHTWFDALLQGRLPFSTRMAGTVVTTTFILSLNYHFFKRHEKGGGLRHLLGLARGDSPSFDDFDTFTPPPMNATLTPAEWMSMQDFETAREVMSLANPGADSFVIRVFAPLIVVLANADRTGAPLGKDAWSQALQSFAIHHFYPAAVAVVFIVAFVAVLMNFLLYREAGDGDEADTDRYEDGITMQTTKLPHMLDIIKLSTNEVGHFVSIALDRTIAVSILDRFQKTRHTMVIPPEILMKVAWPVHNAVVDDTGDFVACHCADGRVFIYKFTAQSCVQIMHYPDDHPAVMFRFIRFPGSETTQNYLAVLTSGGRLVMKNIDSGADISLCLSQVPLLGATLIEASDQSRQLIIATEDASVVSFDWIASSWIERNKEIIPISTTHGRITGAVKMEANKDLGSDVLVVRASNNIVFLDGQTLAVISTFDLEKHGDPSGSLLIDHVTECDSCGSVAFRCIALTSDPTESGERKLVTLTPGSDGNSSICLRNTKPTCQSFEDAKRTEHSLPARSGWQPLKTQGILGLRRRKLPSADDHATRLKDTNSTQARLRRRTRISAHSTASLELWEAYKLSLTGELETIDVSMTGECGADDQAALYVNTAGPTVSLDSQSIAVAFGNTVKIIKAARRGAFVNRDDGTTLSRQSSTNRKRLNLRKAQ